MTIFYTRHITVDWSDLGHLAWNSKVFYSSFQRKTEAFKRPLGRTVKCSDNPSLSYLHLPSGNRHKPALQPPVQSRRSPAGRRNTVDDKDSKPVRVVCWGNSFEKIAHTGGGSIKTSINCHCAASVTSNRWHWRTIEDNRKTIWQAAESDFSRASFKELYILLETSSIMDQN